MPPFEYIVVTEDGNTLICFKDDIIDAIKEASNYAVENETYTQVYSIAPLASFDSDGGSYDEGTIDAAEVIRAALK